MIEDFKNEGLIKREQLIRELKDMVLEASADADVIGKYNKIVDFADHLLQKYPDARSHQLFHVLIGSTTPNPLAQFDFPGDDSIEKFIKEKL